MGRHSDPDPRWFWQSLAVAALKAAVVVALLAVIVVGVTRWTNRDVSADGAVADARTTSPATVPPEADGDSGLEDEPALPADSPTAGDEPAGDDTGEDDDGHGGDDAPVRATVQVLNASGNPGLLDQVVAVLEELGFQVVSTGRAARAYDETTVFYSEGFGDEARTLRREDARFAEVQVNDKLDPTIDLHVVIGADWDEAG